jgi:ABC-2 type transport system permease protein
VGAEKMTSTTYTIWLRNMKRYMRSRSRIIGSLAQPLFFFLALGFGLNAVVSTGTGGVDYLKFISPGIVAMTVLFTSIFSGIQIIWDRQFGFLKETLVAPVSRTSIMLGQTLGGATTALIQGAFIFVIVGLVGGITFGAGLLLAILFMVIIGISFTAFGIAIASKMEDMQGFQLVMNFVVMPVFFLSGALFPLTGAPEALKIIALLNPLAYGVEGIRYGLLGISSINPLVSLGALGGFGLAMIVLGAYLFNRTKV